MKTIFNGIVLTETCYWCGGYGTVGEEEDLKECGECAGLGCHYTSEGYALKNFLSIVQKEKEREL